MCSMLIKPQFFPAARPINAAKSGYSTDSPTYGVQRGPHRWGGRECTDRFIQSCRPSGSGLPRPRGSAERVVVDIVCNSTPVIRRSVRQPPVFSPAERLQQPIHRVAGDAGSFRARDGRGHVAPECSCARRSRERSRRRGAKPQGARLPSRP
eukprot:scaffold90285_cov47-Phaeocystis_antarctica.AAC.1